MRAQTIILLLLCALFAGCQSYSQVTVAVQNTAGEAVPGASVQAAPMYFFNPSNKNYIIIGPYDILEPFPANGDAGITNDKGQVSLHIVTDSPLALNVFAEECNPWKGQISITKQGEIEIQPYPNQSSLIVSSVEAIQTIN